MTKRTILGLALLLALCAAACGSGDDGTASTTTAGGGATPTAADLDGHTFVTSEVVEGGKSRPMAKGTSLTLAFEKGNLSANAGCNTMSGAYEITDGALDSGPMASTMMGCPDDLQTQDVFVSSFLGASPTITLEGDTLTLTSGQDQLVLSDKAAAGGGSATPSITGTTWVLDTLFSGSTASSVPAGVEASLVIADDGTYQVKPGCNSGSGTVTTDGDQLTFAPPAITRMACKGDAMAVEAAVLKVLDGTATAEVKDGALTLTNGDSGLGFHAGA